LIVNGQALDEPYLDAGTRTVSFAPLSIPVGSLFVLGDNRGNSADSRMYGPVPVSAVVAVASRIIWPVSRAGRITGSRR
jgi:signal peptidase I